MLGRNWSSVGHISPKSDNVGAQTPDVCRSWPSVGQVWRALAPENGSTPLGQFGGECGVRRDGRRANNRPAISGSLQLRRPACRQLNALLPSSSKYGRSLLPRRAQEVTNHCLWTDAPSILQNDKKDSPPSIVGAIHFRVSPHSPEIGPSWANLCRKLPKCGQRWSKMDQVWAMRAQTGQLQGQVCGRHTRIALSFFGACVQRAAWRRGIVEYCSILSPCLRRPTQE